jgi:serine/threonine protein kinase
MLSTRVGTGSTASVYAASPQYEAYLQQRADGTGVQSHVVKVIFDIYAPVLNELRMLERLADVPHVIPLVHWFVQLKHKATGKRYAIDSHCSSVRFPGADLIECMESTSFYYYKPVPQTYEVMHRDRIPALTQLAQLPEDEYLCVGAMFTFPALDMNLTEWVESLPDEASPIRVHAFDQLFDAVMTIHENGVYHGDLHAKNVLIKLGQDAEDLYIVLIDFGNGRNINSSRRMIDSIHLAALLVYVLTGEPPPEFASKEDIQMSFGVIRDHYKETHERLVGVIRSLI